MPTRKPKTKPTAVRSTRHAAKPVKRAAPAHRAAKKSVAKKGVAYPPPPIIPPIELTEQSFRLGAPGEKDDLAEELGEAYVQSMTSGSQAAEEFRDEELPEETGGPFIETSADTEFARGTDASNPVDAEPAVFPIVSPQH